MVILLSVNNIKLICLVVLLFFCSCINKTNKCVGICELRTVVVDETDLLIERQPYSLSILNDSIACLIVNDQQLVLYNINTGIPCKIIDSTSIDLSKFRSELIKEKQKYFKENDYNYLSDKEVEDYNSAALPKYLFHSLIIQDSTPFLLASVFTPYIKRNKDTLDFVYSESTFYIVEFDKEFNSKRNIIESLVPHHLTDFKKPFSWLFQGFIVDDSLVYTNVNSEGRVEDYNNSLSAVYKITPNGLKFKAFLDIKRSEKLSEKYQNYISESTPTPYLKKGNKFFVSNGSHLFELITGKRIANNLLSDEEDKIIINFDFSINKKYMLYSCYDTVKNKIFAVVYDLSLDKIVEKKEFEKYTKIAFFQNNMVCLEFNDKNEEYRFNTYRMCDN